MVELQLVHSKCLREDDGNLSIGSNIQVFDFTAQDTLMHKVIMHLDVLCASMEHWVIGLLYATDIVVVDQDRSRHFD